MKRYKVTCKNCRKSDVLTVDELNHKVMYFDKVILSPIHSARWRKDQKWGFECECGNYDLLAEEEKKDFDKLVSGSPMRLTEISKMLKQKPRVRFEMADV